MAYRASVQEGYEVFTLLLNVWASTAISSRHCIDRRPKMEQFTDTGNFLDQMKIQHKNSYERTAKIWNTVTGIIKNIMIESIHE